MDSIFPLAITCLDDGSILNETTVGELICDTDDSVWPELAIGWSYASGPISDVNANTFSFSSTDGVDTITCNETNGCLIE